MSDYQDYQRKMLSDVTRVMGMPYNMFVLESRPNTFEIMVAL